MLLLAVGVPLLDYASQAAINPCEALMSDLMAGQSQASGEAGFTVYSGMLSVGACLGYLITALDWEGMGINIGNREQTSLAIVLILFLGKTVRKIFSIKVTSSGCLGLSLIHI